MSRQVHVGIGMAHGYGLWSVRWVRGACCAVGLRYGVCLGIGIGDLRFEIGVEIEG